MCHCPDNMEVSSCQLQRFVDSVIDPKFLLNIEVTSFCFDKNLSFLGNITFSYMLLFLFEKYTLYALQNDLELPSTLIFSKYL